MPRFFLLGLIVLAVVAAGLVVYSVWLKNKQPVYCTQDAKLCPDGSYVGRVPPKCEFAPCPAGEIAKKDDLIEVTAPKIGGLISSPLVIEGRARGTWYFEASFPIKLLDGNGNILASAPAQAQSDWMTSDFVPFRAVLEFTFPSTVTGTLVLEKDNPSGLPENADELRVPIKFYGAVTPSGRMETIKLYFYNPELDRDSSGNVMCSRSGLVAATRQIPVTLTPIQDTIRLLLQGPDANERSAGMTSEFPLSGLELLGATLNREIEELTLEFDDPQQKTGGGSCRVGILWFQIEATAKQFPEVTNVKFLPEELFQP